MTLGAFCSHKPTPSEIDRAKEVNQLGVDLFNAGDLLSAHDRFVDAGNLDPTRGEYFNNAGMSLLSRGQFKEAIEAFELAVNKSPEVSSYLVNLGVARRGVAQDAAAADDFKKALKLDSQNFDALFFLGEVEFGKGSLEEAESLWTRALKLKKDARLFNGLGMIAAKRAQNDNAEKFFKEAIAGSANYAAARYNLGILYQRSGRLTDAESLLSVASKDSDYSMALYNLALVEKQLGKKSEAKTALNEYLRRLPEHMEMQREDARLLLKTLD